MDKSKINGIEIVKLNQIVDAKGSVLHMIKSSSPEFKNFGECYISEINYNSIKGWKLHSKQTQNISVPSGKIKMVLYDFREDSSTFNQLIKITLGRPNNYFRITIPPGIIYGFKCISSPNALLVNCTDIEHDPDESITLSIHDKRVPFLWDKE
jgi:dTDP-4-dehydrorhamnose 3,5-epimerase